MLQKTTILGLNAMQYQDDSLDLTKPVNLLISLPGVGESTDVTKLTAIGNPFYTLTATSKKNMVIWHVQPGVAAGMTVAQTGALVAAIRAKYIVNAMALYGYSIGGQQWAEWAESAETNFALVQAFYFAAEDTEPLPPYGTATFNPALWAKYRVRDVRGCGTNDGGFWGTQNAKAALIAAAKPLIPNILQPYQGSGHDSTVWGPFSDINGKVPLLGNMDIYTDFNTWFPPAAAVVTPPVVVPPVVTPAPPPAPRTVKSALFTYSDGTTSSLP